MGNMDLSIRKNSRAAGIYFQKMPAGTNGHKIKQHVLRDISKECGEGKFFNRNYIAMESTVLQMKKYNSEYIQL